MTQPLSQRLEAAANAYPEDVFGKTTDEDRELHGDVVQRTAATMGRHFSGMLSQAATALEALESAPKVIIVGGSMVALGAEELKLENGNTYALVLVPSESVGGIS